MIAGHKILSQVLAIGSLVIIFSFTLKRQLLHIIKETNYWLTRMYLHEFQTKQLLKKYGITVPEGIVVSTVEELESIAGLDKAVLKIQVHAGGRGKAGGVRFATSPQEIREHGRQLLGMHVVTAQTGAAGITTEKILIEAPAEFEREFYLGMIIDRNEAAASIIVSPEGGMEIEEIAKTMPEKILVEKVPPTRKLHRFQQARIAKFLGLSAQAARQMCQVVDALVALFFDSEALLLEINPLVLQSEGFVALDAKAQIDDNALFRQPELAALEDRGQLTALERKAREQELAYIGLDGSIGCMVNGAGLAMATMDLIRFWGGEPANFLDVGGSASEEKIKEGFLLLFSDTKVKAVLVNIFGGIMNCELIAKALLQASTNVRVPVVVRMEGTNVESAKQLLANLPIFFAQNLNDAAHMVVEKACLS